MKILLRHLFVSLLSSFLFCLGACLLLLIVQDLFNSIDEFTQNRDRASLIFSYYGALIPGALLMVLPPALLFSTLYTLLTLNRTSQLVAMQACGVSPGAIFLPFIVLGFAGTVLLYFLTLGPGGDARARQKSIMEELRSKPGTERVYNAQVYRDSSRHRTWFVQSLSLSTNLASEIEVCDQNEAGRDVRLLFARRGLWDAATATWTLEDVLVESFDEQGAMATQQFFDRFPLSDAGEAAAPQQMVKTLRSPDEMSIGDLRRAVDNSEIDAARLSPYQAQIDYLLVYPWAAVVLVLFALPQGLESGRRHVGAGVFNAIFLLIGFYVVWNFFLALGRSGRLPPFLAVLIPMLGFGGWALWRIARMGGFNLLENLLPRTESDAKA
ncbi:lipopolysaccharide export system permease protein [Verrucomicrobium sp. GAS474]|uniref:LptF/LptG family permease n=1 Tax=Verrucomicrobium sp. GAS474 TaxID=1882831 RepID=UPI00087DF12F|nr:LptF/LptG family permease [Verrucomicrobium sp. GAS474]SDU26322.1 lipopolysaccharide export system permease protein [Verrucomicrobium sp. GAS474]